MSKELQYYLLVAFLIALLGLFSLFLYYLRQSQKRADRLQSDIQVLKSNHALEVETVQKEIYRQSLHKIATELHDDFGQRLSLIKLMLSALEPEKQIDIGSHISDIKHVTAEALRDLRTLTHQLRSDQVNRISLLDGIEHELSRLKRLGVVNTHLDIDGIPRPFENKTSLILFRMFQESLNNIVAHSMARNCIVTLTWSDEGLAIRIRDDGIGFVYPTPSGARSGLGLANIRKRSRLIGARLTVRTAPGEGSEITLDIPYAMQTAAT